jgi:hypothetical protein
MVETSAISKGQTNQRAEWSWLLKIFLRPKQTLTQIIAADRAVWFPALFVISLAAIALVVANGIIRQRIGLDNPAQLPEYFQYYTPEQQEQFMQALQATSGTAFIFVLPVIAALVKVWLGWLLVGSMVYLALTAIGSGAKSGTALNMVAWASLPFVLRDLVRAGAVFFGSRLIQAQGLAGFTPAGTGNGSLFLSALLALIDIYWIWHVVLVILGAKAAGKASPAKTVTGITLTMLIIILLQALVGFGLALLGSNVSAVQVFF